uniref:PHD-type domain-containing protein n=1 Tax=Hucho hucho TaxID=62062 RepID=A0A4W5Q2G9_9TELE
MLHKIYLVCVASNFSDGHVDPSCANFSIFLWEVITLSYYSSLQDNFTETLYQYDEDGYQSYCTVCCAGREVILCGNDSCCRSYCLDCLNILVGPGTFDSLKEVDPWICYLCEPHHVQGFFADDSAFQFVSGPLIHIFLLTQT